jgi:hypothetical protein
MVLPSHSFLMHVRQFPSKKKHFFLHERRQNPNREKLRRSCPEDPGNLCSSFPEIVICDVSEAHPQTAGCRRHAGMASASILRFITVLIFASAASVQSPQRAAR